MTELASSPALVDVCSKCGASVGLRRHIKSLSGQYYAVCYDCSS